MINSLEINYHICFKCSRDCFVFCLFVISVCKEEEEEVKFQVMIETAGQREPIKLNKKTLNQLFEKLRAHHGRLFVSFQADGVNMRDILDGSASNVRFWHEGRIGHWDSLENSIVDGTVQVVRTCNEMRRAGELVFTY